MTSRLFAAFLLLAALTLARAEPIQVAVPTADMSSSPAPLVAYLFEPATRGLHPAVVMLHGCGGAYARGGSLNARHRMWGELLAANGYVVLMLDSFTSRGVKEICTQKYAERTLKDADRAGDAYAALAFLRGRSDVDAKHVAVLGWSHGGSTVLASRASSDGRINTPKSAATLRRASWAGANLLKCALISESGAKCPCVSAAS